MVELHRILLFVFCKACIIQLVGALNMGGLKVFCLQLNSQLTSSRYDFCVWALARPLS